MEMRPGVDPERRRLLGASELRNGLARPGTWPVPDMPSISLGMAGVGMVTVLIDGCGSRFMTTTFPCARVLHQNAPNLCGKAWCALADTQAGSHGSRRLEKANARHTLPHTAAMRPPVRFSCEKKKGTRPKHGSIATAAAARSAAGRRPFGRSARRATRRDGW